MIRLFAAVFFLQMIVLTPFTANASPVLSIGEYDMSVGETTTVDILLSDIDTDFNSFSFYLNFDSAALSISNVTVGSVVPSEMGFWFGSSIGVDEEDSEIGELSLFYSPFTDSLPTLGTDGVLASFDLTGIAEGEYELLFDSLAFSLNSEDAIAIDATNGIVNVTAAANAVPIPSAILLLGGGLFGMLGIRKKIK